METQNVTVKVTAVTLFIGYKLKLLNCLYLQQFHSQS